MLFLRTTQTRRSQNCVLLPKRSWASENRQRYSSKDRPKCSMPALYNWTLEGKVVCSGRILLGQPVYSPIASFSSTDPCRYTLRYRFPIDLNATWFHRLARGKFAPRSSPVASRFSTFLLRCSFVAPRLASNSSIPRFLDSSIHRVPHRFFTLLLRPDTTTTNN